MLLALAGVPVVVRTLRLFAALPEVTQVILAVRPADIPRYREDILPTWGLTGVTLVPGGAERWQSVAAGLVALEEGVTLVAVHDGARPLLPPELLRRSLEVGAARGAVVLGLPAVDTVKEAQDRIILGTLDRRRLWQAQTPQVFAAALLRRAYVQVIDETSDARFAAGSGSPAYTDDASLVERLGAEVHLLEGSSENLKITGPLDLKLAEAILEFREGQKGRETEGFASVHTPVAWSVAQAPEVPRTVGEGKEQTSSVAQAAPPPRTVGETSDARFAAEGGSRAITVRVGFGYDIHPFSPERPLWLGGVHLPGEAGLAGHSDADVVLHALMDALLGAVGEPDIGHFFPSGDERFRDAPSSEMLSQVAGLLIAKGAILLNADLTVVAERPRLSPHAGAIKEKIAGILGCPPEKIGLKATTNEGLGALGRGEGIAAWALVSLNVVS